MSAQQAKGLVWLLLTIGLAVGAAAGLPRLARKVPWSVERVLARLLPVPQPRACEGGAEARAALDALVRRLYPLDAEDAALPLGVSVVASKEVNAFAGLNGRVSLNDGLLAAAESPEEAAGVLAHELEHVRRRHVIEGLVSRLVAFGGGPARILARLSFGRKQEREADEGGLERLRRARVSTEGYERFFTRDEGSLLPALLSDHPASADRAELVRRYRGGPSEPVLSAAQWRALRAICR